MGNKFPLVPQRLKALLSARMETSLKLLLLLLLLFPALTPLVNYSESHVSVASSERQIKTGLKLPSLFLLETESFWHCLLEQTCTGSAAWGFNLTTRLRCKQWRTNSCSHGKDSFLIGAKFLESIICKTGSFFRGRSQNPLTSSWPDGNSTSNWISRKTIMVWPYRR